MTDTFVPLIATPSAKRETPFTAINSSARSTASAPSPNAARSNNELAAHQEACGQPSITLQRNGDVISSIRIQCGCGQVIELNCAY